MYQRAMRRVLALLAATIAIAAFTGAGHMAPPKMASFTAEQRAQLDRLSGYLNSIRTMKGGFVQVDPNGNLEEGDFYIAKPGRMRFEYRPPSSVLVVSDGDTVAVKNTKLHTMDRYPLTDTPLDLLLGRDIDLNHNISLTGMSEQAGTLVLHARSQSSHAQGDISIVFAEQPLELRQWTIVDAQGLPTTVALRDVQSGADLPGSLFVLRDEKSPFARKSQE
jgi:outer membrane lipoprotein-sorting protein